jgi:hypothetical protein
MWNWWDTNQCSLKLGAITSPRTFTVNKILGFMFRLRMECSHMWHVYAILCLYQCFTFMFNRKTKVNPVKSHCGFMMASQGRVFTSWVFETSWFVNGHNCRNSWWGWGGIYGLTCFFVRFEVFTAVTMKNAVFCDIKTQFVLHRRHITSPLQSPAC